MNAGSHFLVFDRRNKIHFIVEVDGVYNISNAKQKYNGNWVRVHRYEWMSSQRLGVRNYNLFSVSPSAEYFNLNFAGRRIVEFQQRVHMASTKFRGRAVWIWNQSISTPINAVGFEGTVAKFRDVQEVPIILETNDMEDLLGSPKEHSAEEEEEAFTEDDYVVDPDEESQDSGSSSEEEEELIERINSWSL